MSEQILKSLKFNNDSTKYNVVYDWNDLQNRPFGESMGDTLTWDGDESGLTVVDMSSLIGVTDGYYKLVHISDSVPTAANMSNGCVLTANAFPEEPFIISGTEAANAFSEDGFWTLEMLAVIAPTDGYNAEGIIFPKKGVYLLKAKMEGQEICINSFKINGYYGLKQFKYLNSRYIKDMYGGEGASNKLDFLTATPYAYFNVDGIGIPMFQLDGVSADGREIIGITGFNTITYEGETITTPIGPVSADNIQSAQDMITEFGIEGVLAYVSMNDSELGMLMFFCVVQEQPASAIFSTTIKTGWYMLDYAGTIEQFLFGVIPSVNYITAPTAIFSNIKYVPNKYLEILEASSSGGTGGGDTLTWDGNTSGKTFATTTNGNAGFYHMSDAVPTVEDMANGVVMSHNTADEPFSATREQIESYASNTNDGFIAIGELVIIVPTDGYTSGEVTFPKKGIYFIKTTDGSIYTTSFQIPNYTFPSGEEKYTIKQEYLPTLEHDSIVVKSSTEGSTKKFKITVDDSGTLTATEIV